MLFTGITDPTESRIRRLTPANPTSNNHDSFNYGKETGRLRSMLASGMRLFVIGV